MAEPYLLCPPSWRRGTLDPDPTGGLILSVESGSTPSTTVEAYWDGDIPWLTPKDVTSKQHGIFVSETERTLTPEGLRNASSTLHSPGTVFLTKRAPVGVVAVNTVPMAINQGFLAFRCGAHLRPLYLAFWLKANRPYLQKVANGSTYPELYLSDLFEFELAVPEINVQDKLIEAICALQFASLLTIPLEQSSSRPEDLAKIQRFKVRFSRLIDALLPLLLSGEADVSHLSSTWLDKDEKRPILRSAIPVR